MIIYLILLSLKTKFRYREYRRSLLTLSLLILYCSVFLYGHISKSIPVLGTLLNNSPLTVLALFLKLFPFLFFSDLLIKLFFKNNSLYILPSFQTRPILRKNWLIYIALCNVFTLWNFYYFVLLSPYLISLATVNEIWTIFVLLWVSAILNNGICLWLKNYYSLLPIKTLLIGICYFALIGGMYVFIRNIPNDNFFIAGVTFIVLLFFFIIIHFLYLFNQKKVYISESLNKQGIKFNRQRINLSLLKMEFIYILRSKRLVMTFLLVAISNLYVLFLTGHRGDFDLMQIFIVAFLPFPSSVLGQYFFAIEANFFNGIWTKPISIMQLLKTKYIFFIIITGMYVLIPFPFVLFYHLNIFAFFSIIFFIMFVFNLLFFPMALYAKRLDLNSSPFFNTQGVTKIPYIYSMLLFVLYMFFLVFLHAKISNDWIFCSIISSVSLFFFFLRKQLLLFVCSLFIKWRHTIMHRYMNS